nr:RNA-directed DNA polymerase, eukaryota [Tanacetum cinerariifolium]
MFAANVYEDEHALTLDAFIVEYFIVSAIPIYHMSIFKAPMKVLQNMESICACFFNGADVNSKKPSWVRWKSVLAAKDVGGLGVSSLFALNRGLMFKWVWRRNLRGGVEQAQFERLKEMVEGVTLSNSNDRWIWSLVGSGDFSVSPVRKLIDNAILSKGFSKTRWTKEVPIKINVHAWKVIHDCLPTRFNISRRAHKDPGKYASL